jgi:hypothetical protein
VGVQAARIGHDPQAGGADRLGLRPDLGIFLTERSPVGGYPGHGDDTRLMPGHQVRELGAAGLELVAGEFRGLRGGPGDQVGDAQPVFGQQLLLARGQQAGGEARGVQRGPEPVAGAREVVAGRRRVQAGVDAAEEDTERLAGRGQHVRDRAGPGRLQVKTAV